MEEQVIPFDLPNAAQERQDKRKKRRQRERERERERERKRERWEIVQFVFRVVGWEKFNVLLDGFESVKLAQVSQVIQTSEQRHVDVTAVCDKVEVL